jgi:O-antigen ligase
VHNAFLDVAAEEGLLGLVPFIAVTVLSWRDFTRASRAGRKQRGDARLQVRAVLLQTAMLGSLLVSQFQPTQRSKGLWLLFALSTVMARMARAHSAAERQEPRVPAVAPARAGA